jgi:hypothetical protein
MLNFHTSKFLSFTLSLFHFSFFFHHRSTATKLTVLTQQSPAVAQCRLFFFVRSFVLSLFRSFFCFVFRSFFSSLFKSFYRFFFFFLFSSIISFLEPCVLQGSRSAGEMGCACLMCCRAAGENREMGYGLMKRLMESLECNCVSIPD